MTTSRNHELFVLTTCNDSDHGDLSALSAVDHPAAPGSPLAATICSSSCRCCETFPIRVPPATSRYKAPIRTTARAPAGLCTILRRPHVVQHDACSDKLSFCFASHPKNPARMPERQRKYRNQDKTNQSSVAPRPRARLCTYMPSKTM